MKNNLNYLSNEEKELLNNKDYFNYLVKLNKKLKIDKIKDILNNTHLYFNTQKIKYLKSNFSNDSIISLSSKIAENIDKHYGGKRRKKGIWVISWILYVYSYTSLQFDSSKDDS